MRATKGAGDQVGISARVRARARARVSARVSARARVRAPHSPLALDAAELDEVGCRVARAPGYKGES